MKTNSLGGMSCGASVVALGLANELLKVLLSLNPKPRPVALISSTAWAAWAAAPASLRSTWPMSC